MHFSLSLATLEPEQSPSQKSEKLFHSCFLVLQADFHDQMIEKSTDVH